MQINNQMIALNLTQAEEGLFMLLLHRHNEYLDAQSTAIGLVLKTDEVSQCMYNDAVSLQNRLYDDQCQIVTELLKYEVSAMFRGREKGIFDWMNLLYRSIEEVGQDSDCCELKEIFDSVTDSMAVVIEKAVDNATS